MWVILGHSVLAKKSGQHVPGLELGTLSWYAWPLAIRPLPPLIHLLIKGPGAKCWLIKRIPCIDYVKYSSKCCGHQPLWVHYRIKASPNLQTYHQLPVYSRLLQQTFLSYLFMSFYISPAFFTTLGCLSLLRSPHGIYLDVVGGLACPSGPTRWSWP